MIIRNEKERIFIDEVLNLYKMVVGNHYGSVKTTGGVAELKYLSVWVYLLQQSTVSMIPVPLNNSLSLTNLLQDLPGGGNGDINMAADTGAPLFSCHHCTSQIELHTHILADHIIYHLGWTPFVESM